MIPWTGQCGSRWGLPTFGTLIGLLEDGEPAVGVIHFPALGETVYAARGLGCWLRHGPAEPQRVRVRDAAPLRAAFVSACGAHGSDILPEGGASYNLTR